MTRVPPSFSRTVQPCAVTPVQTVCVQNRDSRFLFQMQHQILPVQFVSVRGKLVPKFNNRDHSVQRCEFQRQFAANAAAAENGHTRTGGFKSSIQQRHSLHRAGSPKTRNRRHHRTAADGQNHRVRMQVFEQRTIRTRMQHHMDLRFFPPDGADRTDSGANLP